MQSFLPGSSPGSSSSLSTLQPSSPGEAEDRREMKEGNFWSRLLCEASASFQNFTSCSVPEGPGTSPSSQG